MAKRHWKPEDIPSGIRVIDQCEGATEAPKAVRTVSKPPSATVQFIIRGVPIGKPRQTRSDVWKQRPCVMRYRTWADEARKQAPPNLPRSPWSVYLVAYLPMPASWTYKRKSDMRGRFHQQKPDADNIIKSVLDALWEQDQCVAVCTILKFWDDGNGPRIEVSVA